LKQIKKNRKKLNKLQHQKHGLEDLNEFKRMLGYDLGGELALKEEILEQEQKEDADLLVNENNEVFNSETYTFSTDESNPYDNPPNYSCKVNFEGSDQGKFKVELKQEFFFSYTHEKLKSYFKNQDFLSCEAQLSYLGGRSFLTLHIIIQSKKARESYGSIDRGSMLRIKLINEDKIYLGNVGPSTGLLEPYTGLTSYQVTYAIDKDDLKSLAGNEIDTVGIIWSSGFEDYEILWVDLLQNQAQCILELSKNNNE